LGVDNTLWALSCEKTGNDFLIIKWDPFTRTWYNVPGMQGVAIAAWNEISAAVVTSQGAIYVSSKQENNTVYLQANAPQNSSIFFQDSVILNNTSREWLTQQLSGLVTGTSNLLYRGTRDGFDATKMHQLTDNKGPTVGLIATTKGIKFGGFNKIGWNGVGSWFTDRDAFVFSTDYLIKMKHLDSSSSIIGGGYCMYWGSGANLMLDNGCASGTAANTGTSYENWATKTTVMPFMAGTTSTFTTGEVEIYNFI